MVTPVVNVIIANHNYGKWIKEAIASAVYQDYKNLFITVVDDGSTDDSIEKIEQIANANLVGNKIESSINGIPFVAIKLDSPTGPSNARNIAIHNTLDFTDIYAVLDADDKMMSNKISRCVAEMVQQNLIGVVYADYIIEDIETGMKHIEYKEPYSRERLLQGCIVHSGSLIRKQALLDTKDQFGYYDSFMRTCEDYDLWIRISEKYMISHVPEPLTMVRVHNGNSTNTVDNSIWQQNWKRISDKIRSRNAK